MRLFVGLTLQFTDLVQLGLGKSLQSKRIQCSPHSRIVVWRAHDDMDVLLASAFTAGGTADDDPHKGRVVVVHGWSVAGQAKKAILCRWPLTIIHGLDAMQQNSLRLRSDDIFLRAS